MNTPAVVNAIITRLGTDATLVTLMTGGWKQLRGPLRGITTGGTTFPYGVVSVNSAVGEGAQRMDGCFLNVQVTVVDQQNKGISNIDDANIRIYGDANKDTANAGVPTFGLHVHKLVLGADANGWVGGVLSFASMEITTNEDESELYSTLNFEVHISRVPA